MGGAAPVLSPRRALALGGLYTTLAAWDAFAGELPALADRWDVVLVAFVLLPAALATIVLALPLARARGTLPIALALVALAVAFDIAGLDSLFNVAKLAALGLAGIWFLTLFEALSWVVLVALIIPWVDVLSVYKGPTKVVVEQEPGLFERISIAFRLPGEDSSANLGPPDVFFTGLFLATADRYGLRVVWTWAATSALLGLTLVATYVFDLGGLPALPAISLGFLLPNADLLYTRAAAWRRARPTGG